MYFVNITALMIYRLFKGFGPFHVFAIIGLVSITAGVLLAISARFNRKAGNKAARSNRVGALPLHGVLVPRPARRGGFGGRDAVADVPAGAGTGVRVRRGGGRGHDVGLRSRRLAGDAQRDTVARPLRTPEDRRYFRFMMSVRGTRVVSPTNAHCTLRACVRMAERISWNAIFPITSALRDAAVGSPS